MNFKSKDSFISCFKFSDKFLHMIYGFAGFVFLGFYTQWGFWTVFNLVMSGGIAFEIIQGLLKKFLNKTDGFSYKDIIADAIGASLAMAWVQDTENPYIFVALLGLYLWWEGIPKLRGKR